MICMDDAGISLDKRPGKVYLVAILRKFAVVHKFRSFPEFVKNAKIELLEN